MAAILGSVGTARADDSTIIASKGYVDAYAQKKADRVTKTWDDPTLTSDDKTSETLYPSMKTLNNALTTVEGNIQSVDSNALARPEADNPKLTKVSAIKGMVTTSGVDQNNDNVENNHRNNNLNAPDYASDQKVPSEKAVAAELHNKYDTANTTPVLNPGATNFEAIDANYTVGANLGKLDALKEDKSNKQAAQVLGENETVTRWNASTASDTSYPTVKAVAQQLATVDVSDAVQDGTNALGVDFLATTADKAPSVKAVKGMTDSLTPVTVNSSTRVASVTNAGDDTHVFTTKAVASAFANLDGLNADGTAGISAGGDVDQSTIGQAVVKVTQTDGQVKAELGQIGTAGVNFIAKQGIYDTGWNNGSVSTENDAGANSNLGVAKGSKDTYVPTMLAVEKYVGENAITPNAASGGSSGCDADNPCVLSYYVDNGTKYYKWTKMDIVDLDVVNDSNS